MGLLKTVALLMVLGGAAIYLLHDRIDRDGALFRGLAKLVSPVSGKMISGQACTLRPGSYALTEPVAGWQWRGQDLLQAKHGDQGLVLQPVTESVWWNNRRGAFYYCQAQGDAAIEVTVRTRKHSDPGQYPDQAYQFGGIMLRDRRGNAFYSRENYVFNVIGYRGEGLQIESKSTINGWSDVAGTDWASGDAELKIVRSGSEFSLLAREPGTEAWTQVNQFSRPDFPEQYEIGLIVYSFSYGEEIVDLQAGFSGLQISAP